MGDMNNITLVTFTYWNIFWCLKVQVNEEIPASGGIQTQTTEPAGKCACNFATTT